MAALCSALPQAQPLCKLMAPNNGIGDEGASALALALPACSSLVDIDLSGNLVSEEGQWMLAAARVTCRLGSSNRVGGGGGMRFAGRVVNIDTRRFRHFHPLSGVPAGPNWCFLCYTSEVCSCRVLTDLQADT